MMILVRIRNILYYDVLDISESLKSIIPNPFPDQPTNTDPMNTIRPELEKSFQYGIILSVLIERSILKLTVVSLNSIRQGRSFLENVISFQSLER